MRISIEARQKIIDSLIAIGMKQMKRYAALLILVIGTTLGWAQTSNKVQRVEVAPGTNVMKKVYEMTEPGIVMPKFPGGEAGLMNYLRNTIKYPVEAERQGIEGRVICAFTVAEDGSVTDFEIKKFVDRDGMNCYFKCNKKVSDLTYAVLDGGMVNCYLYVDNSDTQAQLPTVRHFENREGHLWTRTIDYEYYSGGVTFYVTDSDFAGEQPGTMDFRLMFAY